MGATHINLARIKRKVGAQESEELKEAGPANSLVNPSKQPKLKIQESGLLEQFTEVSPIIFEECYAIEKDKNEEFIEMVKNSQELSEQKIVEAFNDVQPATPNNFVGVHLFVLCHGFQGNHNDMRLFKN